MLSPYLQKASEGIGYAIQYVSEHGSEYSSNTTPVPELPSFVAPLALFAALAASVWLLRKRTLNAPVLMK